MNDNRLFNYNDRVIEAREDGYINLTQMCKANDKEIRQWTRLDSTKAYLTAFSKAVGIPTSQLLEVKKGNSCNFTQGTWGHPKLAIRLAQWISPEFAVWCDIHIFDLMNNGSTAIEDPAPRLTPVTSLKEYVAIA